MTVYSESPTKPIKRSVIEIQKYVKTGGTYTEWFEIPCTPVTT
jgi:hypothetical protein